VSWSTTHDPVAFDAIQMFDSNGEHSKHGRVKAMCTLPAASTASDGRAYELSTLSVVRRCLCHVPPALDA
jgi:hypothetical protein